MKGFGFRRRVLLSPREGGAIIWILLGQYYRAYSGGYEEFRL